MALNEYSIVSGGSIFDKADKLAHKWAKIFLLDRGIDLTGKAVLTKKGEIKYRHPLKKLSKVKIKLEDIKFDKNRDICLYVSIIDKKTEKLADYIHFTFSVKSLDELQELMLGV